MNYYNITPDGRLVELTKEQAKEIDKEVYEVGFEKDVSVKDDMYITTEYRTVTEPKEPDQEVKDILFALDENYGFERRILEKLEEVFGITEEDLEKIENELEEELKDGEQE